jgi:hypothetical protein
VAEVGVWITSTGKYTVRLEAIRVIIVYEKRGGKGREEERKGKEIRRAGGAGGRGGE